KASVQWGTGPSGVIWGGVTETPITVGVRAQIIPGGKPALWGSHAFASGTDWRIGSAWLIAFIMFSASVLPTGRVTTRLVPLSHASSATGIEPSSGTSELPSIST